MLRSPLRIDESLAVSFVSETGDTVGRMNPESSPAGQTPVLRLLRGPAAAHQPGAGTWPMEMHQVYRLDGPIAATLTFAQQDQRQCRYTMLAEAEGCIAFLDIGTRSANLFLESRIRDISIGKQGNYTGRANHVGIRNTSSQFQLRFYGRFNINAGQLPERYR